MICYDVSIAVRQVPNHTLHLRHQTDLQIQNWLENSQGMIVCDDVLLHHCLHHYYSPWIDLIELNSYQIENFLLVVVVVVLDPTMCVTNHLIDVRTDSQHRAGVVDRHNIHQETTALMVDIVPLLPKELDRA